MSIDVKRLPVRFYPDFKRVIIRFFENGPERSETLVRKVLDMSDEEVELTLAQTLREFSKRHRNISKKFGNHFRLVRKLINKPDMKLNTLNEQRKLLSVRIFPWSIPSQRLPFLIPLLWNHPTKPACPREQNALSLASGPRVKATCPALCFIRVSLPKTEKWTLKSPGLM